MKLAELRQSALRRTEFEEQLVISPAYFLALQRRIPKIGAIETQPKGGQSDNELTRFRFDAALHIGASWPEPAALSWLDWVWQQMTVESIRELLRDERGADLAIKENAN